MTDTKTQSWCPTCGQNERASEYLSEYVKKLSRLQDKHIKDIEEKDQRIGELEEQVRKHERFKYENGSLSDSAVTDLFDYKLKLEKTILRMAKGIGFYGNSKNWNSQQIISVDIENVAPCDFYYIGGKLAREIQKETASVVDMIRRGE